MEKQVQDAYLEILGRRADPEGMKVYTKELKRGRSMQWLKNTLTKSKEYVERVMEAQLIQRSDIKLTVVILEDTLRGNTLECIQNIQKYCRAVINKIALVSELNCKIHDVENITVDSIQNTCSWIDRFNSNILVIYSSVKLKTQVSIDTLTALYEASNLNTQRILSLSPSRATHTRYEQFTTETHAIAFFVFKNQFHEVKSYDKVCEIPTTNFPYIGVEDDAVSLYRSVPNAHKNNSYKLTSKSIVVLDASTPTPDKDSGSNGIFNMMRAFKEENYDVIFCGWDNVTYFPYYTDKLGALGIYSHFRDDTDELTNTNLELTTICQDACLIVMCRLNTVDACKPIFDKYSNKILFHTLDLHFVRLNREAILQNRSTTSSVEGKELSYINRSKFASVINKHEKSVLSQRGSNANIILLPINIEIPKQVHYAAHTREDIIFVGGFSHTPNVDALEFLIRTHIPYTVHIVGSKLPQRLKMKFPENFIYHGFLPESRLQSLMYKVRLNIVPLRYGAGSKGKIAHACANSLPTITTEIGAEGMDIPEDSIVVSSVEKFHQNLVKMYRNIVLCDRLAINCYNFAKSNFSYENQKNVIITDILPLC